MGSSSSTAGKCLDCANCCVVSNAIKPESGNDLKSSSSEITNHERADEQRQGSSRDSTTRKEEHSTSNISSLSELSAMKIGPIGNEVKKENAEILKERTAKKTNAIPQHGNGQTMLNLISRHFSYLPSDKHDTSYTI